VGRYLAALGRLVRAVPQPAAADPPEASLRGEEAETLWKAIRRLESGDQQVIYLRYFMELSVAETAETLGVAPGTVKSRLSRALNRLRQVIEGEFPVLRNLSRPSFRRRPLTGGRRCGPRGLTCCNSRRTGRCSSTRGGWWPATC